MKRSKSGDVRTPPAPPSKGGELRAAAAGECGPAALIAVTLETRDDLVGRLLADNPKARRDRLIVYADAVLDYRKAAANIAEHGTIVAHPRTGAPIENPYLKIRAAAIAVITRVGRGLKSDGVWP